MESSNSNLFRHSLALISSILCISIPTAFITEDICLKMGLPPCSFDTQRWSQGQARLQSFMGCCRGWYNRRVGFRGAKVGRRSGGNGERMTIELEVWDIHLETCVTGSTQASWGLQVLHSLINSVSKCFWHTYSLAYYILGTTFDQAHCFMRPFWLPCTRMRSWGVALEMGQPPKVEVVTVWPFVEELGGLCSRQRAHIVSLLSLECSLWYVGKLASWNRVSGGQGGRARDPREIWRQIS